MQTMQKMGTTLSWVVGLLSVLGVAFSVRFLVAGGANEGFEQYPGMTNLHVIPGLLYLALVPVQFLKPVRNRFPELHRWSGRLLVLIGVVVGATAVFLSSFIPFSGLPEQIIVGAFGLFYLTSIVQGFRFARTRRFDQHREWMIRAFAIGLSIVTMRLVFMPMLMAASHPTREEIEFYSIAAFTIAFLVHSGFAEFWIRRTRSSPVSARPPVPAIDSP